MFNKNSDRIVAIVPFVLVLVAGVIGMKSDVNLFSWWHLSQTSETSSDVIQHNPQDDRNAKPLQRLIENIEKFADLLVESQRSYYDILPR